MQYNRLPAEFRPVYVAPAARGGGSVIYSPRMKQVSRGGRGVPMFYAPEVPYYGSAKPLRLGWKTAARVFGSALFVEALSSLDLLELGRLLYGEPGPEWYTQQQQWVVPPGWADCGWSCVQGFTPNSYAWIPGAGCTFGVGFCNPDNAWGYNPLPVQPHPTRVDLLFTYFPDVTVGTAAFVKEFTAPSAGVDTFPQYYPLRTYPLTPEVPLRPLERPLGRPGRTDPARMPWSEPDPEGRPDDAPYLRPALDYVWPQVDPGLDPRVEPRARPGVAVAVPLPRPVVEVAVTPPRRSWHEQLPNRPVPRKKISRMPKGMLLALTVFHGATEFSDAVDAFYNALGIFRCKGAKSIAAKMQCIASNWSRYYQDEGVASALATNLIQNDVSDRVMGRLFGARWKTGVNFMRDNYSVGMDPATTSSDAVYSAYGRPEVYRY